MNTVIAGDYKGQGVLKAFGGVCITLPMFKTLKICKETVKDYEIIDKNTQISSFDAVRRANNWSFLMGNAGYAAALGAKSKRTFLIAIEFKDGKKSLLEVNDQIFRAITIALF